MPPSKTWKSKEAELAALFGTTRRPLSGGNSSQGLERDDALHPRIYLECKYSIHHKVWSLWRLCWSHCRREPKLSKRIPVVGLYEKGKAECLLVIHQNDVIAAAAEIIAAQSPMSPLPALLRKYKPEPKSTN